MNIFTATRFTWWQLGLLKWSVLFIGLALGSLWPELVRPYAQVLLVVGVVVGLYLGVVWMRGK